MSQAEGPSVTDTGQKRRTERILLRIPIEVSGKSADGRLFKERTHTLAINRHGARVALLTPVRAGSVLTVRNLQNMMASPFRVVGRVNRSLSGAPEWGLECLEAGKNFWGIFFPEKGPGSDREMIDVLLECSRCHARELAELTLGEYQRMTTESILSRPCGSCLTSTEWTFGVVAAERGPTKASRCGAGAPARQFVEKRKASRVPVKLPVRIRLEEIGRTENLSTCGVCFSSTLVLKVGDRIRLTVGYTPGGNEKEVTARVVWRQELGAEGPAHYGVELAEER